MPRKKKNEIDSKIQEKLDYIGLDLSKIPKKLKEYTEINFRTLKGYDEKKYKQYQFVDVSNIEILLSPTNRMETIKEKYEKAMPLAFYLDSKSEENILYYTKFLEMLNKVKISQIEEVGNEQKKLSKEIPFKVKFNGNYLWQIYYSEISDRYFMIVPTEDADYSTFFYLLKKKIEGKKNEMIFVPISLIEYRGDILSKEEIRDLENYLWLFTKDYPLIYEVVDKKGDVSINIVGETELYERIKTVYKVKLQNNKQASKFYKLVKALFILQTELPHYFQFETNINDEGSIEFFLENSHIEYEILPEFIMQQYLKSVSLKNKIITDLKELKEKLKKLQDEEKKLSQEYAQKEKQITTYLECKKTFFGKVKYFFKLGKASKTEKNKSKEKEQSNQVKEIENKPRNKFKLEERNYTLYELQESFKELEQMEEETKNIIMDINALKLKNKNLKKKIENAGNYIEEINKHKKSIFEFWKYSNKDAVASLDEGEEEELNIRKIEKVFDYEDEFEKFGQESDKEQRKRLTDDELDSCFIMTTNLVPLLNRINLNQAENKEISQILKELKSHRQNMEDDFGEEESFNIFGRMQNYSNKERTIGNKTHREEPRDKYNILELKKGSKGVDLKRSLEKVLNNVKSALKKNSIKEDMYIYKASSEPMELNTIEDVSLTAESEIDQFLKKNKNLNKIYLYEGTNYIAFSNIIYYDNKNMTLPIGMGLSSKILVDLSALKLKNQNWKSIKKLQFEDEEDDFSNIFIKNIEVNELEEQE